MTFPNPAQATAIGGRSGSVASSDGAFRIRLSQPQASASRGGANPEQLFAAAYAACFLEALKIVAEEDGGGLADDANVTATVTLSARPDAAAQGLSVDLAVDLPNLDFAAAEALVRRAEAICPYSTAARHGFEARARVP